MKSERHKPCPCGSTKKYKDCCYIKPSAKQNPLADLLELKRALLPRLIEFSFQTWGRDSLDQAWDEFQGGLANYGFDPADPISIVFIPWYLFNWKAPAKSSLNQQPPASLFMDEYQSTLRSDELLLLQAAMDCPPSFAEVLAVKPGSSLQVFDLLRQKEFELFDSLASKELKVGEVIFCTIMRALHDKFTLLSIGPQTVPILLKNEVLELRHSLASKLQVSSLGESELSQASPDIHAFYLDLLEELIMGDEEES